MSSGKETTKWKNGYWYCKNDPAWLMLVNGEEVAHKSILCLDYPDIKVSEKSTWKFGEFGTAHTDIAAATGVQNYNWKREKEDYGVVNEERTQISFMAMESGSMEVFKYLSDDDVERLKACGPIV